MRRTLRGLAASAFSLILLSIPPAQANPSLPGLTNLNFLQYSGVNPKAPFTSVNPVGWTGGSGLIFIDQPGDSSNPNSACGSTYLTTYGCPSTLSVPGGYNYVEADGNPDFESGFNFSITGLTPGQTYDLTFYQAASQQVGFPGDTTEQWIVSLGLAGLTVCNSCGPFDPAFGSNQSTYSNSDPNASIAATPLMHTPHGGLVDWNFVTVSLTADAPNQLLSFLAWGDDGTTNNLPPIVFLAGVNSGPGLNNVPEPASLSLIGIGALALGALRLCRRRAREAATT